MTPIVLIVLAIAAVDFIQGLINNGNGYIGDILSVKLQRLSVALLRPHHDTAAALF